MKKLLFLLGALVLISAMANADPITFSYARVTRTATPVLASTWTLLNGTFSVGNFDPTCKKIMIVEDSRSLDFYVAFTSGDMNTNIAWLQRVQDGPFDEPMGLNPDFGVYVYTSATCNIRYKSEK